VCDPTLHLPGDNRPGCVELADRGRQVHQELGHRLVMAGAGAGDALDGGGAPVGQPRGALALQFDDTPTGQLTETMLAAIDVYERQTTALRFALGQRAKVARIYKLLRLRGTVLEDPEHGVQLKRRRFSIEWEAVLELRHDTTRLRTLPGT
jgi:hypothetical protein